MGSAWNVLWLTAAFLSEIAALGALAWWGFAQPVSTPVRVVLGIGAPLVAAVLWGVFAAPRAPVQIVALSVLVKIAVFGAATLALVALGHPRLAIALAVVALLGAVLSSPPVSGPASS